VYNAMLPDFQCYCCTSPKSQSHGTKLVLPASHQFRVQLAINEASVVCFMMRIWYISKSQVFIDKEALLAESTTQR